MPSCQRAVCSRRPQPHRPRRLYARHRPLPPCPQRRKDAYRRYCKLRDAGRLKGGQNPPLSAADSLIAKEQLQVVRVGRASSGQDAADPEDNSCKGSKEVSIMLPKEQVAAMLGEGPFAGMPADGCASPTAAAAEATAAAAEAAEEAAKPGCSGRFDFIRFWEVRLCCACCACRSYDAVALLATNSFAAGTFPW